MGKPENQDIEQIPKVVEGEVVEKTATWADVERSWSEVKQTWHRGIERVKAALEEAKQKRASRQISGDEKPPEKQPGNE